MCFFFNHYNFPSPCKQSEDDEKNDSIWATAAGFVKSFNVSFKTVLYDISYENLIMYSRTLPSFNADNKKEKKKNNSDGKVLSSKEEINRFMMEQAKK